MMVIATAVVALVAAAELDHCDAMVREQPNASTPYRCYQTAARRDGGFAGAQRRLRHWLRIDPANHRARLFLAAVLADVGNDRAEAEFAAAIDGLANERDAVEEGTARVMFANFLMRRARLEEAARQLEAAGQRASGVLRERVTIAEAALAYRRNEYGRAQALLTEVERALPPHAPADVRSALFSNLGAVSWVTGRVEAAAGYYRRQAALLRETGDVYEEASARINLTLLADVVREPRLTLAREALATAVRGGNLSVQARAHFYISESSPQPARRDHAERALALSRSIRDAGGIQMALRAVAAASVDDDAAAGFRTIQEAIDLARESGDRAEATRNWLVRTRMRWKTGPREAAIADSMSLLDAIDAERAQQPAGIDRARRFDMWRQPYNELVTRLLSPADALTPAGLELAFAITERGKAPGLRDALASGDVARTLTLADLRRSLQPDEALLEFQMGVDAFKPAGTAAPSWVLVSYGTTTTAKALPAGDVVAVEIALRMFSGLIQRRDGAEAAAARLLFDRIVAPAIADLPPGVARLIVVPDTALYDLPFDTLRMADGRLLGSRYAISIAPSATLWSRWRTQPAAVAAALAIVDPLAPAGARLGPLPFAQREGRAVVASVSRASRMMARGDATEGAIKGADFGSFGLLHFAAHAIVDTEHPDRSAVMLAESNGDDGSLGPSEIERLPMAGKVVVLSACRSANGAMLRGEGLAGLSDAFFRAGAHAVVASLWPLRDDEAALLFEEFYRRWSRGGTLDAALAHARRARAEAGAPAAAWAGVIALGDGSIPLSRGDVRQSATANLTISAAIAAIAASLAFLAVRRRARRLVA